jgi:peroxiredoxin Q/BCP
MKSHEKFAEKQSLNFPLLADPERKAIDGYGVFKEKKMYGKTVMGVERSTFLIDGQGRIREIWRKVKVDGHAEAVLEALKAMNAADRAK